MAPKASDLRRIQLAELRLLKELDRMCRTNDIRYWIDGGTLLGAVRHGGFIPWDDDIDVCMPRADFQKFVAIARASLPADIELDAAGATQDADYNVPCRIRDRRTRIIATLSAVHRGRGLFIDIIPTDAFHAGGLLRLLEIMIKFVYRNLAKLQQTPRNKTLPDRIAEAVHYAMTWLPGTTPDAPVRTFRHWVRKTMIRRAFNDDEQGDIGYGFDVRWTRIFKRSDIFPLIRIRFEDIEVFAPGNPDRILPIFYGPNYMQPPPPDKRRADHFAAVMFDIDSTTEGGMPNTVNGDNHGQQ